MIEKNEIISKIEELLTYLTLNSTSSGSSTQESDLNAAGPQTTSDNGEANKPSSRPVQAYTYAEMLAMYEREKEMRIDIETNFHHKAKESNRQVGFEKFIEIYTISKNILIFYHLVSI